MSTRIIQGDCLDVLRTLPDQSVNCCVTSPPYWGLRDYGVAGQLGLEATPAEYVEKMVAVFREVRRVLRDDGTLWLNLGDSYNAAGRVGHGTREGCNQGTNRASATGADAVWPSAGRRGSGRADGIVTDESPRNRDGVHSDDLKPKDLIGIPWRVAFALQADGWYLRQDIIWAKPNPMPESVRDRCTKSHEYLFLLAKSDKYYCDMDAIAEPTVADHPPGNNSHKGATAYANEEGEFHRTKAGVVAYAQRQLTRGKTGYATASAGPSGSPQQDSYGGLCEHGETRNKRSVWTVATQPFKAAHFATFPPALIEPCILAGCPEGGTVLDPFGGAGTTGLVADRFQRNAILIELNPEYANMAEKRIHADAGMFAEVTA